MAAGLAAVLAAAGLAAGCRPARSGPTEPLGTGRIDPDAATAVAGEAWPFRPASMRIHPLSRVVVEPDGAARLIEARIEFRDAWDDPCKGLGEVQIDLHDDAGPGSDPLQRWYVDLRELPVNQRHFEPVTRTYVLRLESGTDLAGVDPALRAYFLATDGTRLEARLLLQRP